MEAYVSAAIDGTEAVEQEKNGCFALFAMIFKFIGGGGGCCTPPPSSCGGGCG